MRVILAAVVGSLICGLLLVIALGCTLHMFATRIQDQTAAHYDSPMTRLQAEFMRRQAPPTYTEAMQTSVPFTDMIAQMRAAGRRLSRTGRRQHQQDVDVSVTGAAMATVAAPAVGSPLLPAPGTSASTSVVASAGVCTIAGAGTSAGAGACAGTSGGSSIYSGMMGTSSGGLMSLGVMMNMGRTNYGGTGLPVGTAAIPPARGTDHVVHATNQISAPGNQSLPSYEVATRQSVNDSDRDTFQTRPKEDDVQGTSETSLCNDTESDDVMLACPMRQSLSSESDVSLLELDSNTDASVDTPVWSCDLPSDQSEETTDDHQPLLATESTNHIHV